MVSDLHSMIRNDIGKRHSSGDREKESKGKGKNDFKRG